MRISLSESLIRFGRAQRNKNTYEFRTRCRSSPAAIGMTACQIGAELAACDALKSACPDNDDEQYEALYDQEWDLRGRINRTPATTINPLSVQGEKSAAEKPGRDIRPGKKLRVTASRSSRVAPR
jgi:hypothetical protein